MASTLRITNNSAASITVAGSTIAPAAFHDFTTGFQAVAQDVALRLGYFQGQVAITLNTVPLPSSVRAAQIIVESLANGTILP